MENIEFTKDEKGKYCANLKGFTGYLQIDLNALGVISIYANLEGCNEYNVLVYNGVSMLQKIEYHNVLNLHIYCDKEIINAKYCVID